MDHSLSQPDLFGPGPQTACDSLFLAFLPDSAACDQIAERAAMLHSSLGLTAKLRPQHVWHMTLRYLGDFQGVPPKLVGEASKACEEAVRLASPFPVALGKALRFSGSRAFVLAGAEGNEKLFEFQNQVEQACRRHIAKLPPARPFNPHVTLAYERNAIAEISIEPVVWAARELVLVRSFIGQTRHEILGSWPLLL